MSMRGFTLIETLVAVTLVLIAVSAPLYTASHSIVVAELSSYQMTASYLAQEGVEYVRTMRDNAYLAAYQAGGPTISSTAWQEFVSGSGSNSIHDCDAALGFCLFDPIGAPPLTACPSGLCGSPLSPQLYRSTDKGVYTHQGSQGPSTPFSRVITVSSISATQEKITSTVSWRFHGTSYSATAVDYLTPWQ
jgi:prepilin-type N-terminal cleavage/methylation domain-containing protein